MTMPIERAMATVTRVPKKTDARAKPPGVPGPEAPVNAAAKKKSSVHGHQVNVPLDRDPPEGYYRHDAGLAGFSLGANHAHKLDWWQKNITQVWRPNKSNKGEKGPPGFMGHVVRDNFHFHSPDWGGWQNPKEPPATHRIKADGTIEEYTPPPKAAAKAKPELAPPKAKTPEPPPEKKAGVAAGEVGKIISIRGKIPGPGWFRIQGRESAVHVSDSKWIDRGYGWAPRPGEEKGPPGWLGHRGTHTELQEALGDPSAPPAFRRPIGALEDPDEYEAAGGVLTQPKKKEKGVLHFHHPKWPGWNKIKATHIIGKDGTPGEHAAAEPAAKQKVASAPDVKDPIGTILGVLQKKFNKARASGQKYQPNWETLTAKFRLTDDQLEIVKDAYLELITEPGAYDAAKKKLPADSDAGTTALAKKKADDDEMVRRKNEFCKRLKKAGKSLKVWQCYYTDDQYRKLLASADGVNSDGVPTAVAGASTAAAEPAGENAWVGKSMREVVKLTKAELKRLGFRKQRMIDKKAEKYPNKTGPAWMWGGLMRLKQKHPLRRKYAKWYKDYRAKKRAARKVKRR